MALKWAKEFLILSSVYRGKKLIGHANPTPHGTIRRKI
jgi:hypothetical protein